MPDPIYWVIRLVYRSKNYWLLFVSLLIVTTLGEFGQTNTNDEVFITHKIPRLSSSTLNDSSPLKSSLIPPSTLSTVLKQSTNSVVQIYENSTDFLLGNLNNVTLNPELNLQLNRSYQDKWKELPSVCPPPRSGHAMAYDSKLDKVLLFGGINYDGYSLTYYEDTWVYDLATNSWTQLNPPDSPGPRAYHSMVYHPEMEKFFIFGGIDEFSHECLQEGLVFDIKTNRWDYISLSSGLPSRCGSSMVYDVFERVIILFGGYDPYLDVYYHDTWMIDLRDGMVDCYDFTSIDSPSSRAFHDMVCVYDNYDPMDRYFILFGGWNDGTVLGDTWRYDFPDYWTRLTPASSPGSRFGHSMVYNNHSSQIILFGGIAGSSEYSDTWVYNPTTINWTLQSPPVYPSARGLQTMVFFPNSNTCMIFGGCTEWDPYELIIWPYNPFGDTWVYLGYSFFPSGFYESQTSNLTYIYDIHGSVDWSSPVIPTNTSLEFQLGVSNLTSAESFQYYTLNITNPNFIIRTQFLRYRLIFHSDYIQNASPQVSWVNITFNCIKPLPSIQIVNPFNNSIVDGSILITANASSPNGVVNVSFFINDLFYLSISPPPYCFTWNSKSTANGNLSVTAVATTVLGERNNVTIQIVIDNIVYTPPNPPGNLTATTQNGNIALTWTIPSNDGGKPILQYNIYRGNIPEELLLLGVSSHNNFTDTSVIAGNLYYYVVTAENIIGESGYSTCSNITATEPFPELTVPSAPRNLVTIEGENFVELKWFSPETDGGSPIQEYRIYRGITSGEYNVIFITETNSYNDTLVLGNITYFYVVTAVNSLGEGNASVEIAATPEGISFHKSTSFPTLFMFLSLVVLSAFLSKRDKKIK